MSAGTNRVISNAALAVFSSVSLCVASLGVADPVVYKADFESGSLTDFVRTSGNPPVLSTDVARAGRYSMKSVLNRKTSPTSYRTEVTTGGLVEVIPGQDYWYGFSIYLPPNYAVDNIWEVVAQWHNVPDKNLGELYLNPPMGIYIENGVWRLSTLWDSRPVTDKNYEGKAEYKLGPHETGKWTDWVFHVKWSPRSDGLLQVWKNGSKVVDKAGPIGFNDATGPFFKMGIYKGWRNRDTPAGLVSERVLYHDELRIVGPGGKYADVAPGGGGGAQEQDAKPKAPTGISIDPH